MNARFTSSAGRTVASSATVVLNRRPRTGRPADASGASGEPPYNLDAFAPQLPLHLPHPGHLEAVVPGALDLLAQPGVAPGSIQ